MLNPKALCYGVLVFAGLYVVHVFIVPVAAKVFHDTETFSVLWILNQALGFATVGVSGFVAGHIARERRFVHGATVGALGTIGSAVAAAIIAFFTSQKMPALASVFPWLLTNGLLSGIGALLSENYDRKSAPAPNEGFKA